MIPRSTRLRFAALSLAIATASTHPAFATEGEGMLALYGMSGLVVTPTAEVAPDASVRLGYSFMDKRWVPHGRDEFDNELYFLNFGFLSRVELTVRATVLPGSRLSRFDDAPIVDRLGSARILLLRPGRLPALAAGIDDLRGTRFYHSLYVVGTQGFDLEPAALGLRLSIGFGSRALRARNYLLDGVFGGFEVRVRRAASVLVDFDTEKWNSGVRVHLFRRVSVHVAWLNLEIPAGGVAWTHRF